MSLRISALLLLMAASAFSSILLQGVSIAAPLAQGTAKPADEPPPSRLGTRIAREMSARQAELDRQGRALDLREKAAKAMEARLAASMAPAAAQKSGTNGASPSAAPAMPAASREDRFASLAAIYQAMKPKKAAPVFERLSADVQLGIARKMKERNLASILTYMQPDKAAALSIALAGPPVRKGTLATVQ